VLIYAVTRLLYSITFLFGVALIIGAYYGNLAVRLSAETGRLIISLVLLTSSCSLLFTFLFSLFCIYLSNITFFVSYPSVVVSLIRTIPDETSCPCRSLPSHFSLYILSAVLNPLSNSARSCPYML